MSNQSSLHSADATAGQHHQLEERQAFSPASKTIIQPACCQHSTMPSKPMPIWFTFISLFLGVARNSLWLCKSESAANIKMT